MTLPDLSAAEREAMEEGARVRVLATGELATVTAVVVPYMRLVRVDGDDFEIHLNVDHFEPVSDA